MTTIPDVIEGDPVIFHVEPEPDAREAARSLAERVEPAGLYVFEDADEVSDLVLAPGDLGDDPELMVILAQRRASPLVGPDEADEIDEEARGRLRRLPTVAMVSNPDPRELLDLYDEHVNAVVPRPEDPEAQADVLEQTVTFWRNPVRIPSLTAVVDASW